MSPIMSPLCKALINGWIFNFYAYPTSIIIGLGYLMLMCSMTVVDTFGTDEDIFEIMLDT